MNRYTTITFLALLLLILALPIYAWLEPTRMAEAQADLRQEFVSDAAVLYIENCALCHGAAGEGIGPTPALDNPGLREADYDFLYKTIARGRYDTTMSGWHEDEGGALNDYQVDELVALVRYADWSQVGELAAAQGLIPPTLPVPEADEGFPGRSGRPESGWQLFGRKECPFTPATAPSATASMVKALIWPSP